MSSVSCSARSFALTGTNTQHDHSHNRLNFCNLPIDHAAFARRPAVLCYRTPHNFHSPTRGLYPAFRRPLSRRGQDGLHAFSALCRTPERARRQEVRSAATTPWIRESARACASPAPSTLRERTVYTGPPAKSDQERRSLRAEDGESATSPPQGVLPEQISFSSSIANVSAALQPPASRHRLGGGRRRHA